MAKSENVGHLLSQHASGLSSAVKSLVTDAIVLDAHAKSLAFEQRKSAFKLPPVRMDQYMMYQEPNPDPNGKPQYHIIKFNLLVPGCVFDDGIPLVIKRYIIKSTFEAIIRKHSEVDSETNAHIHGKAGLFHFPSVSFDIAEKINTKNSTDQTQHNTFDIEIEMGQGEAAFGYIEIIKAYVRAVNKVIDAAFSKGIENPTPLSEDEAKKLSEEADVPIEEATAENGGEQQSAA